jgi:hypothetical protein
MHACTDPCECNAGDRTGHAPQRSRHPQDSGRHTHDAVRQHNSSRQPPAPSSRQHAAPSLQDMLAPSKYDRQPLRASHETASTSHHATMSHHAPRGYEAGRRVRVGRADVFTSAACSGYSPGQSASWPRAMEYHADTSNDLSSRQVGPRIEGL